MGILRQLIQEQHAAMRKADLAGFAALAPPITDTMLALWCGDRNGLACTALLSVSPFKLWSLVTFTTSVS